MTEASSVRHVKLLFEVEKEDGGVELESLWAVPVSDGYRVDSVPFYAKEVACNDIVSAVADVDGALRYTGLVKPSGHSTVRLWFGDPSSVSAVRDQLRSMGCTSELDLARLVAVDVPPAVPYAAVRSYLESQEAAGMFEYEEACLAQD